MGYPKPTSGGVLCALGHGLEEDLGLGLGSEAKGRTTSSSDPDDGPARHDASALDPGAVPCHPVELTS